MATLPKVLINHADSKSAGGVALRGRTQDRQSDAKKMPRLLDPVPGHHQRAWKRCANPLCLNRCASDHNPRTLSVNVANQVKGRPAFAQAADLTGETGQASRRGAECIQELRIKGRVQPR